GLGEQARLARPAVHHLDQHRARARIALAQHRRERPALLGAPDQGRGPKICGKDQAPASFSRSQSRNPGAPSFARDIFTLRTWDAMRNTVGCVAALGLALFATG